MSRRKQSEPCHTGELAAKRKKGDAVKDPSLMNRVDVEWNNEEKARLMQAMERDGGKDDWESIAKAVKTRNVDQVKQYVDWMMAKPGDDSPVITSSRDESLLQNWIQTADELRGEKDNIDGACIPQVMTIAALEPTPAPTGSHEPDYKRIYTYLSQVLKGQPPVQLSPIDAKVVLELIEDVDEKVSTSSPVQQITFIRQKYVQLRKKLDQKKNMSFNEQLRLQLGQSDPNRRILRPRKPKGESQKLSSLNPLSVPVELLNFHNG